MEATHDEFIALRRAGFDVAIDDTATQRMRLSEAQWRDGDPGGRQTLIGGYPCYRTVDETYATMDQLASAHPNLAQVVDIGPSWLEDHAPGAGHRMRALELTNRSTGFSSKPAMVVLASIHAREYTPAELLTRFAEGLVNDYGTDPEATCRRQLRYVPPRAAGQSRRTGEGRKRLVMAQERRQQQRRLQPDEGRH